MCSSMNFDDLIITALYSKAVTLITYAEKEAASCRRQGGAAEHSSGATAGLTPLLRLLQRSRSQLAELAFYVDFFTKERKIDFCQKIIIFVFQNAPMDQGQTLPTYPMLHKK